MPGCISQRFFRHIFKRNVAVHQAAQPRVFKLLLTPHIADLLTASGKRLVAFARDGVNVEQRAVKIECNRLDVNYAALLSTDVKCFPVRVSRASLPIRALGVKLSLDDFGTEYSSLSYRNRIPLDRLKIDRAFVHDMLDARADLAIVKAIIELGHELRLQVVAEGVESEHQATILRGIGCDGRKSGRRLD